MSKTAENNEKIIKEGDFAPDFTAPVNGGAEVTLSDFRGKKNVVLYFYPKDDTPGCTIEAKDFTDRQKKFAASQTVILGVSKDSVQSHDKFIEKHCLSFPLVSDETAGICEAFEAWGEKNMYGKKYMGVFRTTFLIDKKGIIRKIWNNVKVDNHAEEVLKEAQKIN